MQSNNIALASADYRAGMATLPFTTVDSWITSSACSSASRKLTIYYLTKSRSNMLGEDLFPYLCLNLTSFIHSHAIVTTK